MGRKQPVKAADLDELRILREIARLRVQPGRYPILPPSGWRWVMRWELKPQALGYEQVPEKVLLAKLRKMRSRGLIDGCMCGCRGDLELTEQGEALISPP